MRIFFTIISSFLLSLLVIGQQQRALIIGIDKYNPPTGQPTRSPFADLNGAKNDALSIYSLITSRFNFPQKNITTLLNDTATRDNIIVSLNKLLSDCKQGDIAFFFYAGHGSQVLNKKSREADQRDESIVPADYWKEGVKDIRDKELATIFNLFLDKGIKLTVIMDCCHSGSLTRGPGSDEMKTRYMAEPGYFVEDESIPEPPEKRPGNNFLVIGACQDSELAKEQTDDDNTPHGALTTALLEALKQQSINAAVSDLFASVRAIIKSNGFKQEPVMGAGQERQQQTLFGISKGILKDKCIVAVSAIYDDFIELQGGTSIGIYKQTELVKLSGNDTIAKLRVDSILSITQCLASVVKGNKRDIHGGDLFEVSNWISSGAPLIKFYIPENSFSSSAISGFIKVSDELKQKSGSVFITDLERTDPFTSIYFNKDICYAKKGITKESPIKIVNTNTLLPYCVKDSTVFFELPAATIFSQAIISKLASNKSFMLVKKAADANYTLYGTIINGLPAYGFRKIQTSAADSLGAMPVQTNAILLNDNTEKAMNNTIDSLYLFALRLSKLRGWMHMSGPLGGKSVFPYHLELFRNNSDKGITNGNYRIGDDIMIKLVANKDYLAYAGIIRYIYIFYLDRNGNMSLLFPPPGDGNQINQYPKYDNNKNMIPTTSFDILKFKVEPPGSFDNYFLLATEDAIPVPENIFNQQGVYSKRGITDHPLSDLLETGNEGSTRAPKKLARNWSLQRLSFISSY